MTDNEFNRISEQYIDIVYRSAINNLQKQKRCGRRCSEYLFKAVKI